MKIRAAVLEEFGAPLVVREVELAEPRAGEVLVRLVACGVCHTDLYTASGADPSGYAPTVLGHEGAGVVEQIGDGVTSLAVGDLLLAIDADVVNDVEAVQAKMTQIAARKPASVVFRVKRGIRTFFVELQGSWRN